MNLRDIKKDIEYVLSAFVEDCSVVAAVNSKASEDKIAELMEQAIDLYNELRDKVNAKAEGPKKAYYASLRKEILEKTNALYEQLSATVKASLEAPQEKAAPAAKKAPAKKAPAKKEETPAKEEAAPAAKKAPAKKAPAKKKEVPAAE